MRSITEKLEGYTVEILDMMDKCIKENNIRDYKDCLEGLKRTIELINSEKKSPNQINSNPYTNRPFTYL